MAHTAARSHFTVTEANRALPLVRSIVADIVADFTRMKQVGRDRRALEVAGGLAAQARGRRKAAEGAAPESESAAGPSAGPSAGTSNAASSTPPLPTGEVRVEDLKAEMEERSARIDGYIKELADLGVELKDPEKGLVDFPSERGGRAVWLCWRLGEEQVGFWHGIDETYFDRRVIEAPRRASPESHAGDTAS